MANDQLELFEDGRPHVSQALVDSLVNAGFIGECSGVKNHMKTANNLFGASCVYHDVCYTRGGSERDRNSADRWFYKRCILNAASLNNAWAIWYYIIVATVWFMTVRLVGWAFFKYGPYLSFDEILKLNKASKSVTLTKYVKFTLRRYRIIWKRYLWPMLNMTATSYSQKCVRWLRSYLNRK